MKSLILALSLSVVSIGLILPADAEARRFGGGGSSGMQRSMPSRAPESLPARPPQAAPTTPTPSPAGVPVAAPRRSWMGPIAGLAAGLGIAALMSHFGFGAGFGNLIMMVLLGLVAFAAIRFVMRRFAGNGPVGTARGGMQYASASGAPAGAMPASTGGPVNGGGSGWAGSPATQAFGATQQPLPSVTRLPAGFDAPGFERVAKMIFIRMQTANDSANLEDLRTFTTPEMFASVRLELQERGNTTQVTDVVRVDAEVLEVVSEADRQLVSVRFHGLIREEQAGPTAPFDEIWHLVKPLDGNREWAIAGIQQAQAA